MLRAACRTPTHNGCPPTKRALLITGCVIALIGFLVALGGTAKLSYGEWSTCVCPRPREVAWQVVLRCKPRVGKAANAGRRGVGEGNQAAPCWARGGARRRGARPTWLGRQLRAVCGCARGEEEGGTVRFQCRKQHQLMR